MISPAKVCRDNVIAIKLSKRCTKYVMFLMMNQDVCIHIACLTCRVVDERRESCCTTHYSNVTNKHRFRRFMKLLLATEDDSVRWLACSSVTIGPIVSCLRREDGTA